MASNRWCFGYLEECILAIISVMIWFLPNHAQAEWRTWDWEYLSAQTSSSPECVESREDSVRVDCFFRRPDNSLWHRQWTNGVWSSWNDLRGVTYDKPSCVATAERPVRLHCLFLTDSQLFIHKIQEDEEWSWRFTGNRQFRSPPECVAMKDGSGRVDCFARGLDNAMWHAFWVNGLWSNWESLGGDMKGTPSCVATDERPVRIHCFVLSRTLIKYKFWDGENWSDWQILGLFFLSPPECVATKEDPVRIHCFARLANNSMFHIRKVENQEWGSWENLGGRIGGKPECTVEEHFGATWIYCFARGTDGKLKSLVWTGRVWAGWDDLGGRLQDDPSCIIGDFQKCVVRGQSVHNIPDGIWTHSIRRPGGLTPVPLELRGEECDRDKREEILEDATNESPYVKVDCYIELTPRHRVTKRLIFEGNKASDLTFDCHGATIDGGPETENYRKDMIEVRSRQKADWSWERPENLTIANCVVNGSTRIYGAGKNANRDLVRTYSRTSRHTRWMIAAAPHHISFRNIKIVGQYRNPFYAGPGVTYLSLTDSDLLGETGEVAIYLDAETAYNTIKDNYIHMDTLGRWWRGGRQQIALDGSADNRIIGNLFSGLRGGGIFLYRNCGEYGTIRHQGPQHNQIISNIFFYNRYTGGNPSVYLGARTDHNALRWYCGDDGGYSFGSSRNDNDFAKHNIVADNLIYKRKVEDMIRQSDQPTEQPNEILRNLTAPFVLGRSSSCYMADGFPSVLMKHGGTSLYTSRNTRPQCTGVLWTCLDGSLKESPGSCPVRDPTIVYSSCGEDGDDEGCSRDVACPYGKRIVSAKAACNLEQNRVSSAELNNVGWGLIKVLKASDNVADGNCSIGGVSISRNAALLTEIERGREVEIACREHDRNGGDCRVSVALACR